SSPSAAKARKSGARWSSRRSSAASPDSTSPTMGSRPSPTSSRRRRNALSSSSRRTRSPAATSFARPSAAELAAARAKTLRDVIAPGLKVLFCGINPGLYSAATGNHFARPGNRFWPALHAARFTPRLLSPFEERELLAGGWGITNIVDRATASADVLTSEELIAGARRLERKVRRHRPRVIAFLGITSYRTAFGKTDVKLGRQEERLGESEIWILPNPSGLNAHYQIADLTRLFKEL